jgi:uncharacterized protein (UPF0335 family)
VYVTGRPGFETHRRSKRVTPLGLKGCRNCEALPRSGSSQTPPAAAVVGDFLGDPMTDVGGIAGDQLRSYIERVERLSEEKDGLTADIREVYAEAKGNGFSVPIMRAVVRLRKLDKDDRDEQETILDLYRRALGMD